MTPGAAISAASGHNYATPLATAVPEPGSLSLLGLGLSGVALAARRRA